MSSHRADNLETPEEASRCSDEYDEADFPMDLIDPELLAIETKVNANETTDRHDGHEIDPLGVLIEPKMSEDCKRPPPPRKWCSCPPKNLVGSILMLVLGVILLFGVTWSLVGTSALPGGSFFALIILLICCIGGGEAVRLVKLPPLLGMLVVGCLLRNIPKVNVAVDIDPAWSSSFRSIALVIILIRAGLGLDPVALKKLSFSVVRLAFAPCLAETLTALVTSYLFLGFPIVWGLMLGFVLSAVSPAVVVPFMLYLQESGLGTGKGIPTLVVAAASIDDVLAISGFGVAIGIAFAEGNLIWIIFKGPLEAILGVVFGLAFGLIVWYIPPVNHPRRTLFRFLFLFGASLIALLGSRRLDLSGAGALGCLTVAFVAAIRWRKTDTSTDVSVSSIMAELWIVGQPFLFGLIGAEVNVMSIEPKKLGFAILILFIGLAVRIVMSFIAVLRTGLNAKEKAFVSLAWLPKATVQAAIGSVALDTARALPDDYENKATFVRLGSDILMIAVMSIVITAPLGAIAISLSAKKLLVQSEVKEQE